MTNNKDRRARTAAPRSQTALSRFSGCPLHLQDVSFGGLTAADTVGYRRFTARRRYGPRFWRGRGRAEGTFLLAINRTHKNAFDVTVVSISNIARNPVKLKKVFATNINCNAHPLQSQCYFFPLLVNRRFWQYELGRSVGRSTAAARRRQKNRNWLRDGLSVSPLRCSSRSYWKVASMRVE